MTTLYIIFFPVYTGDKRHQFCPDIWVPTATVISNWGRKQWPFVNFAQLCIRIREEEWRKRLGVTLVSWTGKDRVRKRRKSPTFKVRVTEIEVENRCEDWNKISVYAGNPTQDRSLHMRAWYHYATTAALELGIFVFWSKHNNHRDLSIHIERACQLHGTIMTQHGLQGAAQLAQHIWTRFSLVAFTTDS